VGVQRAHVELYVRGLGERGLMDSSVVSMMNGVREFFRFAHIDGLIPADPAVYPGCPRSSATSPAPKAWTASS
jgi:integrase/recombinase XerD